MNSRLLLCTDLDRTLVPNGPQPESPGARRLLARMAARPELSLAYVTGRHRALVEQAIANYCLPLPDFVIADVGTTVYRIGADRAWSTDPEWRGQISEDWHDRSHGDLLRALKDESCLRLQELAKQGTHKLSYYLPAHENTAALENRLLERLAGIGVRARLVWSIDEMAGIGLLDVLPARASKRHAIEYLAAAEGYAPTETVFCGDSGNDLEVLVSPVPSVLVANARPELRRQAIRRAESAGNPGRLYCATGGFLGMNGNYSAGILEGVAHYHADWAAWLREAAGPLAEDVA